MGAPIERLKRPRRPLPVYTVYTYYYIYFTLYTQAQYYTHSHTDTITHTGSHAKPLNFSGGRRAGRKDSGIFVRYEKAGRRMATEAAAHRQISIA